MKTLKKLAVLAFTAVFAFGIAGCSQDAGESHSHTFETDWTSNETHHWHNATCGHTDVVKDNAEHDFPETWSVVTAATEEADGLEERFCTVCNYRATRPILQLNHTHTIATEWSKDATHHWREASCGKAEHAEDNAVHTWDYEDYKYDSTTGKDIRTCTVCSYVAERLHTHTIATEWSKDATHHWHEASCGKAEHAEDKAVHTEDSGEVTTAPTCVTKGVRTFTCSVCGEVIRNEDIPELYSSAIDVTTGNAATKNSKYVYFGVFPRTVKASSVTVDETKTAVMGPDTYYKGSDGEWYAKVTAKPYYTSNKYSDGTKVSETTTYFKVEPIKWKVLTTDYNGTKKALLLAEDILTANVPYYNYNSSSNTRTVGKETGIYPNNYKYSQIRAYLNGLDYYYDTSSTETTLKNDYTGKGFLQTAFTAAAQALIADTVVNNKAETTGYSAGSYASSYACGDTTDKIFLLSESEVINSAYGFAAYNSYGDGNARISVPTDYAKANYAYQSSTACDGGRWWLRSPSYGGSDVARFVHYDGGAGSIEYVSETGDCVVPALCISLPQN